VLFSLVVVVATRFGASVPSAVTAHAGSGKTAQRMNQDAVRWFAPILQTALLLRPEFRADAGRKDEFVARSLCEPGLYNRPPPLL
jgi:hypothetical protein